jgi:tyrosyl-tRNA synthetase
MFYALMQGYDAVATGRDIQIGGTDQLFNLLAGRKLMEASG